ncbi:hypothetical protein D9M71_706020 [compost metagenome]
MFQLFMPNSLPLFFKSQDFDFQGGYVRFNSFPSDKANVRPEEAIDGLELAGKGVEFSIGLNEFLTQVMRFEIINA